MIVPSCSLPRPFVLRMRSRTWSQGMSFSRMVMRPETYYGDPSTVPVDDPTHGNVDQGDVDSSHGGAA